MISIVNYLKTGKKDIKMISKINKYTLVGLSILVFACSNVKEEPKLEMKIYDNQVVKEIGYLTDTIKIGTWYEFDQYGYLNFIFNYEDGQLSGKAYEYRRGKLFGEYHFENGKLSGASIRYQSSNQQLLDIENYFEGKPKGIQLYFDSLGILSSIENGKGETLYSVE